VYDLKSIMGSESNNESILYNEGIPSRSGVVTNDLQSAQSITGRTALACVLVYSHPHSAVDINKTMEYMLEIIVRRVRWLLG